MMVAMVTLTTKLPTPTKQVKPAVRTRAVPAVSRAIAILRLLGKAKEPMGVNAIAQALDLIPSTCLHILRTLVEERLIAVDSETKRYRLGMGMLTLARSAREANAFPSTVQAGLDRLSSAWGVTAIGVDVTDQEQMVVVALSRSNLPFRLHVDVGSVFPALLSATGRLVAAFGGQPMPELKRRYQKLRWDKPLDFEAWYKEVAFARKHHHSIDRNTYIAGLNIAAVPVLDDVQRITHTIVCASLADQLTKPQQLKLINAMQREARLLMRSIPE
jgi:DNA-binding IclR family transcriptional regulator